MFLNDVYVLYDFLLTNFPALFRAAKVKGTDAIELII